jgi:hypothetical protein
MTAEYARRVKAKRLLITHFSLRYTSKEKGSKPGSAASSPPVSPTMPPQVPFVPRGLVQGPGGFVPFPHPAQVRMGRAVLCCLRGWGDCPATNLVSYTLMSVSSRRWVFGRRHLARHHHRSP